MSEFNDFVVSESGILAHCPQYGVGTYRMVIPREIFVEAYNKYIDKPQTEQIKEQSNE